jgi:L-alanine-DL-glutamate epimerase-like enolase superfamily enzyme
LTAEQREALMALDTRAIVAMGAHPLVPFLANMEVRAAAPRLRARHAREDRPMKIVKLCAIPMSAPVPEEKRHRTDLGTKVKSDATLIRVETDSGLTGIGAALGTPPIVAAIVEHELAAECVGEDPMFSERIYEKMYSGSRSGPALERGVTQADESRRRGVVMEAIAGIDIAVWDVKAQALGIPLYQALGAARTSRVASDTRRNRPPGRVSL